MREFDSPAWKVDFPAAYNPQSVFDLFVAFAPRGERNIRGFRLSATRCAWNGTALVLCRFSNDGWVAHVFRRGEHDSSWRMTSPISEEMGHPPASERHGQAVVCPWHPSNHLRRSSTALSRLFLLVSQARPAQNRDRQGADMIILTANVGRL